MDSAPCERSSDNTLQQNTQAAVRKCSIMAETVSLSQIMAVVCWPCLLMTNKLIKSAPNSHVLWHIVTENLCCLCDMDGDIVGMYTVQCTALYLSPTPSSSHKFQLPLRLLDPVSCPPHSLPISISLGPTTDWMGSWAEEDHSKEGNRQPQRQAGGQDFKQLSGRGMHSICVRNWEKSPSTPTSSERRGPEDNNNTPP